MIHKLSWSAEKQDIEERIFQQCENEKRQKLQAFCENIWSNTYSQYFIEQFQKSDRDSVIYAENAAMVADRAVYNFRKWIKDNSSSYLEF